MKKKALLLFVGLLIFVVGFAVGYEYKTYQLRKIFIEADEQINQVLQEGGIEEVSVVDSSRTKLQQTLEDKEILEINMGNVVELATVDMTIKSVEERDIFNRQHGDPLVARENAKFVIVGMDIVNTTSETFNFSGGEIQLVDSKKREYMPSRDLYSSDGDFVYRDIMPNLKESGILMYEVPEDSENYSIFIGKAGTDLIYKVILR